MQSISRAIIIAAGEGKRLRPVTLETPKPLVKINGKRIIDTGIEALQKYGIRDIYIVVGYKKELFYEIYRNAPGIHLIENPYYLDGNNITSMYAARQYLPNSFVLEGDIIFNNPEIFAVETEQSYYMAAWKAPATEWVLSVVNGRIIDCDKKGNRVGYQLYGISKWNKEDGEMVSEEIRKSIEEEGINDLYWDEVALRHLTDERNIGIREIREDDICEIDTLDELIKMDGKYIKYKQQ